MNWITVIWSMVASACLTLAAVHGLVWFRQRDALANLMFALMACGTAGMAAAELGMMQAATPAEYALLLRWFHVPVLIAFLGMVGFIRFYLGAGRTSLAWIACGMRTISLVLNFLIGDNLNYLELESLHRVQFLGRPAAVPLGVPNPLMLTGQLSLVALLVFVVDAAITTWRSGDRRLALLVGLSTSFFVLASTAQALVVFWGYLQMPMTASLFFTGLVVTMGHELSSDLLRARMLATELQRQTTLTDAVFDSVPGLLYLYTKDGRMVRWNKKHEDLTGYTGEELSHMTLTDWFDDEDMAPVRVEWERVFAEGHTITEIILKRKDGAKVPYLATGVRLEIEGKPHMVGIAIDISERKRTESEITQQREQLAHLSRVASLGELSGSLAHELNQPLGIILSNAQAAQSVMARDTPDLKLVNEILTDIVGADRRAGDVIKRLRALLERGETIRQPVDINENLEEVLRLTRSDLIGRGVAVTLDLEEKLPRVLADRIQIQQVFLNLIVNARDAMDDNASRDQVLTLVTSADGDLVHIAVSDRGCGLPQDVEQLFKPFFTRKTHGLGMGLAICRKLVIAHEGRIWAEPNADRGATFHVTFPALKEAA